MKKVFFATCLFCVNQLCAQTAAKVAPLNPLSFGVVLDDPLMKNVKVQKDVTFLKDSKGSLNIDIYTPPNKKADVKLPAVIFLNAIGDRPGEQKVKSWGIYTSWPTLMATQGYIGISMEADGARIQESIESLFKFLSEKGNDYGVDTARLGVYAASANVAGSVNYLMGEKANRGIKAVVLYYGGQLSGPFRKDLPVFFVVSEGDVSRNGYQNLWTEVLKNNAPWTIKMGTGMPHAFDAYSDNDEARKIIKETISFWKNNLDPVAQPSWAYSEVRDIYGSAQMDKPKTARLLKSLSEEYPNDPRTQAFYAEVLRDMQMPNESIAQFQRVLKLDPKNVDAYFSLAGLMYQQNKPAEAEAYIAQAEKMATMRSEYYSRLGRALLIAEKNKEAAVYYEKAISIEAKAYDYYNLACAYAKINDADHALKAIESSIKQGYGSKSEFENDRDFNLIKSDDRFKKLIATAK